MSSIQSFVIPARFRLTIAIQCIFRAVILLRIIANTSPYQISQSEYSDPRYQGIFVNDLANNYQVGIPGQLIDPQPADLPRLPEPEQPPNSLDAQNGIPPPMQKIPIFKSKSTDYFLEFFRQPGFISKSFWVPISDIKFVHAFIASFSLTTVSELGDKTFFIVAIMSMRKDRLTVFVAAMSALVIMNFISGFLGVALTVLPFPIIHYSSIVLFLLFGLKMLIDFWEISDKERNEEYEDVQKTLNKRMSSHLDHKFLNCEDPMTGVIGEATSRTTSSWTLKIKRKCLILFSVAFIETFIMTFLAEWADRSQLSSIILTAREDVWGVTLGSLVSNLICTGGAVMGGRALSHSIPIRAITLTGSLLFIGFALYALSVGEEFPA